MNQHDFEGRVLHLWMTTRVPLTRANLIYFTGAPRKRAEKWLDAMVSEGVLDVDSDDEGEMIWAVRGAARPAGGPTKVEDVVRLESLKREVSLTRSGPSSIARRGSGGGSVVSEARGFVQQALAREGGEKNLLLSGALSVFGPLGWLYAGPVKEAVPAAILWYAVLLPLVGWLPILGWPIYSFLVMASVAVGVLYATQYNRSGHVTPMFGDDGDGGGGMPRLPGGRGGRGGG